MIPPRPLKFVRCGRNYCTGSKELLRGPVFQLP